MGVRDITNPRAIIDLARSALGMECPYDEMTDDDIGEAIMMFVIGVGLVRRIGPVSAISQDGIDLMISLAILEFPDFYERNRLWQLN